MHMTRRQSLNKCYFFFNDTATTEIYTLSLHDALPISKLPGLPEAAAKVFGVPARLAEFSGSVNESLRDPGFSAALGLLYFGDRKSTRLNSSHLVISYAVFCLKKKKTLLPRVLTSRMHA